MTLPIIAYGDPILRKIGTPITATYPNLKDLINDMKETMKNSFGVGLAAPQIGKSIRLFIVNTSPFAEDDSLKEKERIYLQTFKKVFINPEILDEDGEEWTFNEGCLSIPDVRENVVRKERVTIKYFDENFEEHTDTFSGLPARVVQHEYDHIEGILFTDKLSSLKKRLLKKKLENISKGKIKVDYKMKFPLKK